MASVAAMPRRVVDVGSIAEQIRGEPRPIFGLIGAGLSSAVSGPTWKQLLAAMGEQLNERANAHVAEDVRIAEQFQQCFKQRDLKGAADIWKRSRIHYDDKQRLLGGLLSNLRPGPLHRDLVSCGLNGILTFNYDHLLEDAYAHITGRSLTPFLPSDLENTNFYFGDEFFVAKLHGDLARWDSIVIGETDYAGARWPDKIRPMVNGATLLVFGISLLDSIVNEFLFSLHFSTRVHVFMPEEEIEAYREKVQSMFNRGIPGHISLHDLSHEDLPALIHRLAPPVIGGAHIHSSWGDMPRDRPPGVDFHRPAAELRDFLFSDKRLAHVESQPGWGLSSFLAQVLADRGRAGDALAVRLEAKEWLCWDKYALQILATVKGLWDKYSQLRDLTVPTATVAPEPHTLVAALGALGRPVAICIEQSHRLRDDSIEALRMIMSEGPDSVKLVLASSHALPSALTVDVPITLPRPRPETLIALAELQGILPDTLRLIHDQNPEVDLNTLVIAGALLQEGVELAELAAAIHDGDLPALCKAAKESLSRAPEEDAHLLRALKACVIFRSPRTAQGLQACLNCSRTLAADRLRSLWRHGLLVACEADDAFTMSTSIREQLQRELDWEKGEYEELSGLIGAHQKDRCLKDLDEGRWSRKGLYEAVPHMAEAIWHFGEAGDRRAYLDAVNSIARPLIQMYHYQLIMNWLDGCPASRGETPADTRLNWTLALLKADLAIAQCATRDQQKQLSLAESALQKLERSGQDISKEQDELEFYRGIVAAGRRDYTSALNHFNTVAGCRHATVRRRYDARLRMAQTKISAGNLLPATEDLDAIENDLEFVVRPDDEADLLHCRSVIAIHRSTLATVRLQLFSRKPAHDATTRESFLNEALQHAAETARLSEELSQTKSRRARPDRIGIGLAHLKRAQAYFAFEKFDEALTAARAATSILGSRANNRWWLMTCHDIAARALARLRRFEEARGHLSFAQSIWDASAQDDPFRAGELKFTQGLIALEASSFEEAVQLLEQSVDPRVSSPCIMALHLEFYAQALARAREPRRAEDTLRLYFAVPINW